MSINQGNLVKKIVPEGKKDLSGRKPRGEAKEGRLGGKWK
jgi:hypothetical protein